MVSSRTGAGVQGEFDERGPGQQHPVQDPVIRQPRMGVKREPAGEHGAVTVSQGHPSAEQRLARTGGPEPLPLERIRRQAHGSERPGRAPAASQRRHPPPTTHPPSAGPGPSRPHPDAASQPPPRRVHRHHRSTPDADSPQQTRYAHQRPTTRSRHQTNRTTQILEPVPGIQHRAVDPFTRHRRVERQPARLRGQAVQRGEQRSPDRLHVYGVGGVIHRTRFAHTPRRSHAAATASKPSTSPDTTMSLGPLTAATPTPSGRSPSSSTGAPTTSMPPVPARSVSSRARAETTRAPSARLNAPATTAAAISPCE